MAYEKLGLETGDTFRSSHVDHLETGIADAHDRLDDKADSSDIPDVSGFVTQSAFAELAGRVEALENAADPDGA